MSVCEVLYGVLYREFFGIERKEIQAVHDEIVERGNCATDRSSGCVVS